jgi:L-ribulose-5-phosphate 3-epimerase
MGARLKPHAIGIIQGRLLPMVGGRIQAFPGDGWEREFPIARDIGFDCIELTIEMASFDSHPIRTPKGRATLRRVADDHHVALAGLCCDTAMELPLTATDPDQRRAARDALHALLRDVGEAELPMLELPMLGAASLAKAKDLSPFEDLLDEALHVAEEASVDLLLETDLDGPTLAALLARHPHPRLAINYDTGNSNYFGFRPTDEIGAYGERIGGVHIKDTTRAEYSRPLGQGEVAFDAIFGLLAGRRYRGAFIIQAARQNDDVGAARAYYEFTRRLVQAHWPNG